jgi:hypothetical protein
VGIILDKKPSWQPHLQHIKFKLATQTNVFSRLTASTLGISLPVSRLLDTTVVHPANTTNYPAWFDPHYMLLYCKELWDKLLMVKNCCLRTVSGAYRATPVRIIQAKVRVPPPSLHMDGRQAKFCLRSGKSGMDRVIYESLVNVRQFVSCTRTRYRHPRTPRNWQTASNRCPPTLLLADPAPLAASQLSWAQ